MRCQQRRVRFVFAEVVGRRYRPLHYPFRRRIHRPRSCRRADGSKACRCRLRHLGQRLRAWSRYGIADGHGSNGVLTSVLFSSPDVAFSPFAPLFGLYFGVVDGAVAGFTFVWLGRRKSAASRPVGADNRVETAAKARLRWFWVLIGLGLGIPASALVYLAVEGKSEPKLFPIAGVSYRWPSDTTVLAPEPPPNFGKGYVRYRSSSRYPDRNAFLIIYDGNAQEPRNPAGLPHLQMVTSGFGNPEEFSFRTTSSGQVVCNRRSAQVGLAYPCGLSFVHRRARWQLHFGAHQASRAELLHKEAVSTLETFRRRSGK
jgi:hypothetical protein